MKRVEGVQKAALPELPGDITIARCQVLALFGVEQDFPDEDREAIDIIGHHEALGWQKLRNAGDVGPHCRAATSHRLNERPRHRFCTGCNQEQIDVIEKAQDGPTRGKATREVNSVVDMELTC